MKQLRRGYPYLELSFVWIIVLSTSLSISSLYLFLYYMIEDFGVAKTERFWGINTYELSIYSKFIKLNVELCINPPKCAKCYFLLNLKEMADVYEEALLEKQNYHEGCPGCKVEKMKKLRRGYPYLELSFVWIIVLSTSLPISSLYPFLYHMIEDFGIATTEKDIGFYAGFVGCSFMLGRASTSLFWGIVADRYGRKPIILLGTITIAVFNALFGMSVNFWMAIATRFLLGTFNCLLGTMKAYTSEIFREEYQATAMSAVSTAWGIGLIVGPALGGFLAQTASRQKSKCVLQRIHFWQIPVCVALLYNISFCIGCDSTMLLHTGMRG